MVNAGLKELVSRRDIILCMSVCLPVVLLFVVVSFYNHPVGDDFWCTAMVKKYGFWKAQRMLYDIVPPRYLELALSCLTPLSFGSFWGYKLIPVLYIVVFFYVVACCYGTLTGSSRRNALIAGVLFTAIYLSVLPGMAEGIYWASALSVYHTGIILFIVWCNYLLKWYYLKRSVYQVPVICLCLAGMYGCNELISIAAVLVLLAIAWHGGIRRMDVLLLVQVAVSAVVVLVVTRFGGAFNRYGSVQNKDSGRLLFSLGYAFIVDGYYIGRVLINPFFWAILLLGAGVLGGGIAGPMGLTPVVRLLAVYRRTFMAIWAVLLVIVPMVMIYISGERPPLRICNMIVFFFLSGLIVMVGGRGWFWKKWRLGGRWRTVVAGGLLIVGLSIPDNVSHAAGDLLSGDLRQYDRDWNERIQLIRECRDKVCVVPHLRRIPWIFWFEPDGADQHISEYFDKTIIVR